MKKCIYLKGTEPQLMFKSGEHIIPAGLGGIMKLQTGLVSDQVNTQIFSPLELDFMRNSHISLPRQFYGPGKRGSLATEKASKSNVHIMESRDDGSRCLGYIKLGKPCSIPQFRVGLDEIVHFNFDKADGTPEIQLYNFSKSLKKFDGIYHEINDKRIPEDEYILGIDNAKWFLAKNPTRQIPDLLKAVGKIIGSIDDDTKVEPQFQTTQITSHQSFEINMDGFFRVCAKIVFNFLALSKGQDFVLLEEFDPIRNWILNGGENKFVQPIDKNSQLDFLVQIPFPELSHKIIIAKVKNSLIGIISFYGTNFEAIIQLTDNMVAKDFYLDGFICDWKNKKEYRFLEFINSLSD